MVFRILCTAVRNSFPSSHTNSPNQPTHTATSARDQPLNLPHRVHQMKKWRHQFPTAHPETADNDLTVAERLSWREKKRGERVTKHHEGMWLLWREHRSTSEAAWKPTLEPCVSLQTRFCKGFHGSIPESLRTKPTFCPPYGDIHRKSGSNRSFEDGF